MTTNFGDVDQDVILPSAPLTRKSNVETDLVAHPVSALELRYPSGTMAIAGAPVLIGAC